MFGEATGQSLFDGQTNSNLFSNNIFSFNNNNQDSTFEINSKKIIPNSIQCNHVNKYVAYNTIDIAGPICYSCIHKYNLQNENCIPIEENYEYYKNIYQNYLNLFKERINNVFTEFLEEIDKLNVDKFDNFYTLFDNLELNFVLPIEVSLEERIEIGISKKLLKMVKNLNNKIYEELPYSFLNLYETKLKDLKTKNSYSYDCEKFTLNSEIPFTLRGFAIPKISKELEDNNLITFNCKNNNIQSNSLFFNSSLLLNNKIYIKESKIKKNLTIIKLENAIDIKKNQEYQMTISGIKGLTYIDNKEKYNIYKKISIQSENKENILACLIIE